MYWLKTVINASYQNLHPTSNQTSDCAPASRLIVLLISQIYHHWSVSCVSDCRLEGLMLQFLPPSPKWPTVFADEKWGAMWEVGQTALCQFCSSGGGTVDKHTCTHCSWYGFNPLPIAIPVSARQTHTLTQAHTFGFACCDAGKPQVACCFVPFSYWRHLT